MNNYEWNTAYNDLCKEIEVLEIRRDELQGELRIIQRRIMAGPRTKLVASYSGMPGGSGADTPLPQMWATVNSINEALEVVIDIIDLKKEAKRRMEERMSKFDTLEYKVAYLRDVERKSLAAIATEIGYSYDWVAKVSAKVKRLKQEKTA